MAKETNRPMGHADEADGIEEFDNPLPDWWLGLLWLTIVWAVGYGVHYHFIAERSAVKELASEMAAAEIRWPAQAVDASQFAITPEAVAAGRDLYAVNCVVCHGPALEGVIGPSLIDEEFVHGNGRESVLFTIDEGVLDKGMPNWGALLGPEKVNQLAAFVISEYETAVGHAMPAASEPVEEGTEPAGDEVGAAGTPPSP
ncbi:MAG: cbb3-type cytochrome c oxidase N-terminal domain-containing protein [Longimicrobiales bacterium]